MSPEQSVVQEIEYHVVDLTMAVYRLDSLVRPYPATMGQYCHEISQARDLLNDMLARLEAKYPEAAE